MDSDAGCAHYNLCPPYTSAPAALFRAFAWPLFGALFGPVLGPAFGPAIRIAARIRAVGPGALHRDGEANPAILVDQIAACRARLGPRQPQTESRAEKACAQPARRRSRPRREEIGRASCRERVCKYV